MSEYRGNLYIFVETLAEESHAHAATDAGEIFGLRQPGETLWYLNGWAVGKNSRGRYCARTSASKLQTFDTFAAAMDFVRKKRKARPLETFYLVYDLDGQKSIVTSLEQIRQIDGFLGGLESRTLDALGQYPILDTLAEKVGKIVATNALVLLRTHAEEGEAAARARFSPATYERLWQVLQEAALVEGVAPA